ncbi:conserved hypothetical protein [Ricinus communis]|uniref:Uncharacterized protein n=1 Tax=Ricinus communis TaxID=3988 RepID=B9S8L9_RICCO|nr:conserved hypothetical protein [Ricinus communis]
MVLKLVRERTLGAGSSNLLANLWLARNAYIFHSNQPDPIQVTRQAKLYWGHAKNQNNVPGRSNRSQAISIHKRQTPPELNGINVNIDASWGAANKPLLLLEGITQAQLTVVFGGPKKGVCKSLLMTLRDAVSRAS